MWVSAEDTVPSTNVDSTNPPAVPNSKKDSFDDTSKDKSVSVSNRTNSASAFFKSILSRRDRVEMKNQNDKDTFMNSSLPFSQRKSAALLFSSRRSPPSFERRSSDTDTVFSALTHTRTSITRKTSSNASDIEIEQSPPLSRRASSSGNTDDRAIFADSLRDEYVFNAFMKYLVEKGAPESHELLFYQAVSEYKVGESQKVIAIARASEIFDLYIPEDSKYPIKIGFRGRKLLEKRMDEIAKYRVFEIRALFNSAQKEAFETIFMNHYDACMNILQ